MCMTVKLERMVLDLPPTMVSVVISVRSSTTGLFDLLANERYAAFLSYGASL